MRWVCCHTSQWLTRTRRTTSPCVIFRFAAAVRRNVRGRSALGLHQAQARRTRRDIVLADRSSQGAAPKARARARGGRGSVARIAPANGEWPFPWRQTRSDGASERVSLRWGQLGGTDVPRSLRFDSRPSPPPAAGAASSALVGAPSLGLASHRRRWQRGHAVGGASSGPVLIVDGSMSSHAANGAAMS